MINVRKRGNYYQYSFEAARVGGKRKQITKSGFNTKAEAEKAGVIAYNEYMQTGRSFKPEDISYSDYLDYWMKEYCEVNLKYHTIEVYKRIIRIHIKPFIGHYLLPQITTATLQEFINEKYLQGSYTRNYLHNMLKVVKGSFTYACDGVGFIKENPSLKVKLPKYDVPADDPAHIFTQEEVDMILNRFTRNHCMYYAALTAYHTGLRVSEVFGLTWEDIDFEKKTLRVDRNILKKNQAGGTKKRHISGNSTTVWYFGTCKTPSSYRTIEIGDTLVNALKEYKKEQEENQKQYGDCYMKHYAKEVVNPYNGQKEIKIINAIAEIEVALPEVHLVFVKKNGIFEGTDTCKYPFKVIHYELGIPCRFHDFRDTHATRLIESGADIKAVAKRLGHKNINVTYDIYVKVTAKMKSDVVDRWENYAKKELPALS